MGLEMGEAILSKEIGDDQSNGSKTMGQTKDSELTQQFQVTRFSNGTFSNLSIDLAKETPYTLFVNDEEILSISTLPTNLVELFIGFLVSEGVLTDPSEILETRVDRSSRIVAIEVDLSEDRLGKIKKKGMLTSGCAGGIVFSVEMALQTKPESRPRPTFSADLILKRMKELDTFKGIYNLTRGTHAAAVASVAQSIVILEDIGRHNAIDKIIGYCFLRGIDPSDKILLTTGRITSEAATKASRFKFPIIVSRSSASSTAVNIARQVGLDVVTYARAGRFNFFSHGAVNIVPELEQKQNSLD